MGLVTVTIKSNGTVVNPEFELLYIDITNEFNKIPSAEISYNDGDFASESFVVSDSAFFEPGSEVEILLRYEDASSSEKSVFKGVVVKQGLQTSGNGCVLIAELSDKAIKMTGVRKSAISENIKDSDIIQKIISSNGLSGSVEATAIQHEKIVQYYVTDWDFLISRAEVNGLFVSVKEGKISAAKPEVTGHAVQSFSIGSGDIYNFEFEVDARTQFSGIESSVWDLKSQQLTTPAKATEFRLEQGNLQPAKLAKVAGNTMDTLVSAVSMDVAEAKAWADAKMVRSRLSMLKGRLKVMGTAEVNVGDLIELKGIGKRFSGTTLVTAIRHQVNTDGWSTDIQFGLDAEWFLSKNTNVVDVKASGLLPGVNGLQIGVVLQTEGDPENEDRVKVKVPAINDESDSIWARIITIDAGNNRGVAFWPEPGDEVILGFLNDDPRQPIILGSVHSSANPSPIKAEEKNAEKGIITKQGLKMLFNDEEKTIIISTSDDSMITINEKQKSIEVKDVNNNSVKLSDSGIAMQSDKDIIIKSGANVKIEGRAVEIKGDKVDVI